MSRTIHKGRPAFTGQPAPELVDLMRASASYDPAISMPAMIEIAKAIETPLQKGVMNGAIADGIFAPEQLQPGRAPEYELDLLVPGTESQYNAYTIGYHGYIPQRAVDANYIMVSTFPVANAIDWPLRLVRDANINVIQRATEIFNAGFIKKSNDDALHTLLAAAKGRGVLVWDGNAGPGRLTLAFITKMQQTMRRLAGGNTTSTLRGKLTDMFVSIEGFQDMRSWTLAEIDEVTRREVFTSEEGGLSSIYGTYIHDLFELGAGQEYQLYYTGASYLNGSLHSGDTELAIGLDLQRNDSFMEPIREAINVQPDPMLARSQRGGIFGTMEHGFVVLDNRRIVAGSY